MNGILKTLLFGNRSEGKSGPLDFSLPSTSAEMSLLRLANLRELRAESTCLLSRSGESASSFVTVILPKPTIGMGVDLALCYSSRSGYFVGNS